MPPPSRVGSVRPAPVPRLARVAADPLEGIVGTEAAVDQRRNPVAVGFVEGTTRGGSADLSGFGAGSGTSA